MSIQGHFEVLVVGAGPTGLTLGASLAQRGVRALVVDKSESRSLRSKALAVQAGTLEALGQSFGQELPERMVAAGHAARSAFFHFGNQEPVRMSLRQIPSPYNFVLVLPQSETERFLEEQMTARGLAVERRTELVSIRDDGARVVGVLRDGSGSTREVTADFAVGCDGAHSVVRRDAGIAFAGGSYRGDFILGDVTIDWPWSYSAVRLFVSDHGFLGCFPMPGEKGSYRLIMASRADQNALTPEISAEEFAELAASRAPRRITIMHDTWLTRFNLHHRTAGRFRAGRLFLAGDAAHIHSPVGGQGMNTGIQDSLNLGWRLAEVLRGGRSADMLDGYQRDRLPVARSVLRRTDRAFRAVLALNTSRWRRVRLWLAPHVVGMRWFQRRMTRTMSQVELARREMAEREPK